MGNWHTRLREPRIGIMLHYDASASDAGAVAWLTKDPRCRVSYHRLVLDAGPVVEVAPMEARAWHAGVCRPSDPERMPYVDANSAFYGFCVAARAGDTVPRGQRDVLAAVCQWAFQMNDWPLTETWRITDHAREAWPRGRKVDIGTNLRGLTLEHVRQLVAAPALVGV